jgi:hypothetical protein
MKKIILSYIVFLFIGISVYSQVTVYSENFNAGMGGWTSTSLTSPWGNTSYFGISNIWQSSDAETGMAPNICGMAGGGNPSLYLGATALISGAAYLSNATTNKRISSPNINTTGYSNLTLSFNFIGYGCEERDKAYLQYSIDGGTSWTSPTSELLQVRIQQWGQEEV